MKFVVTRARLTIKKQYESNKIYQKKLVLNINEHFLMFSYQKQPSTLNRGY